MQALLPTLTLGAKSVAAPSGVAAKPVPPPTTVLVARVQKGPIAHRLDTIGTVQPLASVALRTRIDAQIDQVLVKDGASVKAGDVLVRLDDRQIKAQIEQAQAALAKDQTQLDQSKRDVKRYTDLVVRGAGTQINVDTAKTSVAGLQASVLGDQAALDNLKVQLTWYTLKAPIDGRIGTFASKVGNIIRSGDSNSTGTLATINQVSPIYVAFSLPQSQLPELRVAMANGGAKVGAKPQGQTQTVLGKVAFVDNAIDPATGTITAHALFENADEKLWPGQLCDVRVTLSVDPQAVTLPREAVQDGQNGNYVFVIENNLATLRLVTVARLQDEVAVISKGLQGHETVVLDGALRLVNGSHVIIRNQEVLKEAAMSGAK